MPDRNSDIIDTAYAAFCRNGRPEELAAVFDASAPGLMLLAAHVAPDATSAEDAVQTAFLQLIEGRGPSPGTPILPWLLKVVGNRARDEWRRQRVRRPQASDLDEALSQNAGPLQDSMDAETVDLVAQAIENLSEQQRQVLVLNLLHGLEPTRIAYALGHPPATVRTWLHRGLNTLRERLPRGVALALVCSAGSGLAQVRRAMLEAVPEALPVAAATTAWLGALTMKKAITAIVLLSLVTLFWIGLAGPDLADTESEPERPPMSSETAETPRPARQETDAPVDRQSLTVNESQLEDRNKQIWGRVLRLPDDAPIAGAAVHLVYRDGSQFYNLDLRYGETHELIRHSCTTDADGRFLLRSDPGPRYSIRVEATGFPATEVSNRFAGAEVTVRVGRAAGATIQVLDNASGNPVPGALVLLLKGDPHRVLARGTCNAAGEATFLGLPPESMRAEILGPRHREQSISFELLPGQHRRLSARLKKGRVVVGQVRDAADGTPIAGARVTDSWTFGRFATTDSDGKYELPWILGKRYTISIYVQADGYAEVSRTFPDGLPPRSDFALPVGGKVTGRVVGRNSTAPAGCYVALGTSYHQIPVSVHTHWIRARLQPDGSFAAEGLNPKRRYFVYARAPQYGARTYALPRAIPAGSTEQIETVQLQDEARIHGRVVDSEGEPIAKQMVSIFGHNSDALRSTPKTKDLRFPHQFCSHDVSTDTDGRFSFGQLADGTYTIRTALPGSSVTAEVELQLTAGEEKRDLTLELDDGLTIQGTLSYPDGRKITANTIWLEATREGEKSTRTAVGRDGNFAFRGLKEGRYSIRQWHKIGHEGWRVEVFAGVAAGATDLELRMLCACLVSGQVVDADSKGVAAEVWWSPASGSGGGHWHRTKPDGTFSIEVPPGFAGSVHATRSIEAFKAKKHVSLQGIQAGHGDLRLQLPR